jgi:hypothetical protein
MTPRPSRQHYHVQTREPNGAWVSRGTTSVWLGAIEAAEGLAAERCTVARVLLGREVRYTTAAADQGASA